MWWFGFSSSRAANYPIKYFSGLYASALLFYNNNRPAEQDHNIRPEKKQKRFYKQSRVLKIAARGTLMQGGITRSSHKRKE